MVKVKYKQSTLESTYAYSLLIRNRMIHLLSNVILISLFMLALRLHNRKEKALEIIDHFFNKKDR